VCQNSAEQKPSRLRMLRRVGERRSRPILSGVAGLRLQR
jgi:hypothetical protein